MAELTIFIMTAVAVAVVVILRVFRQPVTLERRVRHWAMRQKVEVMRVQRRPDHLLGMGLPPAGYEEVELLVRDSNGATRTTIMRFSSAVIGQDSEAVVSVSPHKNDAD
jgi:hypothetical protein